VAGDESREQKQIPAGMRTRTAKAKTGAEITTEAKADPPPAAKDDN
jgi:hypothetical protein